MFEADLGSYGGGLLPWQVNRVRAYVGEALDGRIALADAAGQARLSAGYFSRCFRRSFGLTFSQFVARERIERALRLMVSSSYSLSTIALACGFADQAHFTRTFGAVTGSTPARWRRQATNDVPSEILSFAPVSRCSARRTVDRLPRETAHQYS
jgi:AraC family transcriptional regulator